MTRRTWTVGFAIAVLVLVPLVNATGTGGVTGEIEENLPGLPLNPPDLPASVVRAAVQTAPPHTHASKVIECRGQLQDPFAHHFWQSGRLAASSGMKAHCFGVASSGTPPAPALEILVGGEMQWCNFTCNRAIGGDGLSGMWYPPTYESMGSLIDAVCTVGPPELFVCGEAGINHPFSYDQWSGMSTTCETGCESMGVVQFTAIFRFSVFTQSGWTLTGDDCVSVPPDRDDMQTIECYDVAAILVEDATPFAPPPADAETPPCLDLDMGRPICT